MATAVLAAPVGAEAASTRADVAVGRIAYLDRLKVLLVALIIAGHGLMGYSDLENAWPYQDVQEVALPESLNVALGLVVLPAALFAMGLFFLISGLLTPPSLARKGPRRFARDRAVRLGLPLIAWVLVIWPAVIYAADRAAGRPGSFWSQLTHADPPLDAGPMWFVEVLLIFSLAYAAWRARGSDVSPLGRSLTGTLATLAFAISLSTVAVRIAFPLGSNQIGQLHLWQWPQCLALFVLGIVAARRSWLNPIEPAVARLCGRVALAGIAAFLVLAVTMAATSVDPDVLFDEHLHWAASVLALIEGPVAIGAAVWLLAKAQQRLGEPLAGRARAVSRSAFAAFVLQGVVLVGIAVSLRPLGVPAEVKAITVALIGTVASFALGWLIVTRTVLGRVL